MDEIELSEPTGEVVGAAQPQQESEGVATGSGAVAAGGSIEGSTIASGKGAVSFDGDNEGNISTGSTAPEPEPAVETVVVETVVVETVVVETPGIPPEPVVADPEPIPPPLAPEPSKLEEAKVVVEEAFEQLFNDEAEAVRYLKDPPAWLAFSAVDPEVAATVEFGQVVLDVALDMTETPSDPASAPDPPLRPAGPEVSSSSPPADTPSPSAQPGPETQPSPEPTATIDVPPLIVVEQTITRHVVEVFEGSPAVGDTEVGGIMADGSADGAVVGDGNTVNNVFGAEPEPEPPSFGVGDSSESGSAAIDDPSVDDSPLSFGEGAEIGYPEPLDARADTAAADLLAEDVPTESDEVADEAELVFAEAADEPQLRLEDAHVAIEPDEGDDLLDD